MKTVPANQRGSALLVVIWAVVLLAGLIAGMVATGGSEAALTSNMINTARANHLAAAGVQHAILALLDPDMRAKLLNQSPAEFSVQLADDATIGIRIQDSCGDIDLNWSPPELLRAYAMTVGLKTAAAGKFAEAVTAHRQASPHASAAWQSVRELGKLPGIGGAEFAALSPGLTVNCREAGADPRRAGAAVKRALLLAGTDGSVSHELAYQVESRATLVSGAEVRLRASIWLSLDDGKPYRIAAWERF